MPNRDPQVTENQDDDLTSGDMESRTPTQGRHTLRRFLTASRPGGGGAGRAIFQGDPDERETDDEDDRDADDATFEVNTPVRGPGHDAMDRVALEAALDASGFAGSFDHLSGGEEQRVRLLLHYRDRLPLVRPHLVAGPAMIARLRALDAASPNFAVVSELVARAAHLSFKSGYPLRVPPVLMLGAPGVGKTRYARALAAALHTSLEVVSGASIPDTGSLTGYPPAWRGAGPGRIAKAIVAAPTSGPLIFVDECEKIVDHEASACPMDRLLTLLEPHSAASFEDEHLKVPMRAQHVTWLFAANSLERLSEPFRDRVITVTIPSLGPEQRDDVLEAMLAEVAREAGMPVSLAGRDVLKPLHALGLRRSRLAFEIAIPRAIERGRRFLTREDLDDAVQLLGAADRRPRVGFLRHRGPDGE